MQCFSQTHETPVIISEFTHTRSIINKRVSIKTAVSLESNTPVVWAPSLSSDSFGKHVSAQREAA